MKYVWKDEFLRVFAKKKKIVLFFTKTEANDYTENFIEDWNIFCVKKEFLDEEISLK